MRFVRRARRQDANAHAGDGGFTLVETVVAITILAGVFVSAGAVFSRMLIGTLFSRQNQQAADVISEEIETLRAQSYSAVAMNAADLTGDPKITTESGVQYYDPDGAGPIVREKVVTAVGGVVTPHIAVVTRNSTRYTVSRYVTDPGDATGKYRRVTVVADWVSGNKTHTRRSSTFVTLTRRGLPLPNFTFTGPVSVTQNQGTTLALPVTLTNRGATDSWSLSGTNQEGRAWTVRWYTDDGNGWYDAGSDIQLTDSDGDGRAETPLLGTDVPLQLWAVVTLSSSEAGGDTHLVLTAQSNGQPSSPTGTASVTDTITVVAQASCSGCTYRTHYLHNSAAGGNTVAGVNLPVDLTAPTATSLSNYDTNVDGVAGRKVTTGGTNATASGSQMVNWRYQAPAKTTYNGNAVVTVWVMPASGTTSTVQMTAYLNYDGGGPSYTNAGSATASIPAGTWSQVQFTIPVSFSLTKNKKFEVKLVTATGTGLTDALVAYDTTTYPAHVDMPVRS
jgi:type II secretory pathway pseudopilin PulG